MVSTDMNGNHRILRIAGPLLVLALLASCRREVSTEPHVPAWVPVPEGVELQIVNWQVGEESVEGTAIGRTDLDIAEMQRFYGERMRARDFEVQVSPVLQGGEFAQLSARAPGRDRGLNISLSRDGSLVLQFSQER